MTDDKGKNGGTLSKAAWFLAQENYTVATYRAVMAFLFTTLIATLSYIGSTTMQKIDSVAKTFDDLNLRVTRIEQEIMDAKNNGGKF